MKLPDRLAALVALAPRIEPIVDVGADHGLVAEALGAVAVERLPHRRGRANVRWVVADGLRPFREVGTAVIAGMGARRIVGILEAGPTPKALALHAQDEPDLLRRWLATHGWRIDAEALAPEGRGFAQVLRAYPGEERSSGIALDLGPRLLEGGDPLLLPWLRHEAARQKGLLDAIPESRPDLRDRAARVLAFVEAYIARRSGL
jgi:tRNA A22 N-methylase